MEHIKFEVMEFPSRLTSKFSSTTLLSPILCDRALCHLSLSLTSCCVNEFWSEKANEDIIVSKCIKLKK